MKVRLSLLILAFSWNISSIAGNDPIVSFLQGSQIETSALDVDLAVEDQFYNSYLIPDWHVSDFYVTQAGIKVKFRWDDSHRLFNSDDWEEEIDFDLTVWYLNEDTWEVEQSVFDNVSLKINYTTSGAYSDFDVLDIPWAVKAELKINSIERDGDPDTAPFSDLLLELEQYTSRNRWDEFAAPNVHAQEPNNNQMLITWNYVLGAESYDVEWLFVDHPDISDIPSGLDFDFKNATRINTHDQYYVIPIHYPEGIIIYRVRAVGKKFLAQQDWGDWSFPNDVGNVLIDASPGMIDGVDYVLQWEGTEEDYNWQYSVSFAEGGKRSESINYFDGGLKPRQNVTFANTNGYAVVGQPAYDLYGRGVINFLPTPVPSSGIHFHTKPGETDVSFNGDYDFSKFDIDLNNDIQSWDSPEIAENGVGSHNYYSDLNEDHTGYSTNDYIPSAEGYPFSFSQIKNDGTGRIVQTGGAGQTFRLGGGHEAKIYYSKPTQEQLDRLFGSEAILSAHASKVTTVDANGQSSVAYADQFGHTIATALVGPVPENLLELDLAPEPETLVANLLDNNTINAFQEKESFAVISNTSGAAEVKSMHYNLGGECYESCCYDPAIELEYENIDNCVECVYDLEIKIIDSYGEPIDPSKIEFGLIEENGDDEVEFTWSNPLIRSGLKSANYEFTITVEPGISYYLTKTLRINTEYFNEEILPDLFEKLVANQLSETTCESTDCYATLPPTIEPCLSCEQACLSQYTPHLNEEQELEYYLDGLTILTIEEAERHCFESCNPQIDLCETKRKILIADMSPGGQYFDNNPSRYLYNLDGSIQMENGDLVLNPSYDHNGWLESDTDLSDDMLEALDSNFPDLGSECCTTWDEVRANWTNEFSETLLPFHPEYVAWRFFCTGGCWNCGATEPLEEEYVAHEQMSDFMDKMNSIQSKEEATNNSFGINFFNPFYFEGDLDEGAGCVAMSNYFTDAFDDYDMDNSLYAPNKYVYHDPEGTPTLNAAYDELVDCGRYFGFYLDEENCVYNLGNPAEFHASHILNNLRHFIEHSPGEYYSIWYVLENPESLHTCTTCSNVPQEVLDFFVALHDNTDGAFNQIDSNYDEFHFFRSVYTFLREFALYNAFKELNGYGPFLSSPEGDGHTADGFRILYPENPIFEAFDEGGMNFIDLYDQIITNEAPEMICETYEDTKSLCEEMAETWLQELEVCEIDLEDADKIKALFASVCACGATADLTQGQGDWSAVSAGSLIFGECESCLAGGFPGVEDPYDPLLGPYLSLQDVLDAYGYTGCVAPCYPDQKEAIECAWNSFMDYLHNRTILIDEVYVPLISFYDAENQEFTSTTEIAEAVNLDYGEYYIDNVEYLLDISQEDVEAWLAFYIDALDSDCSDLIAPVSSWPDFPFACSTFEVPDPVDPIEICNSTVEALNEYNDADAIANYIENFVENYRSQFFEKCLQSSEVFTMEYELNEYYYTLYYYDQAGNLTKTVPPQGVRPLLSEDPSDTENDFDDVYDVAELRASGLADPLDGFFIWPAHRFVTNYKYNSHEQIIESTTPDGGKSLLWYDKLDRPVLSQNARQREGVGATDDRYSYILYDDLGRTVEAGEIAPYELEAMTWEISRSIEDDNPATPILTEWMNEALATRSQLVHTIYDESFNGDVLEYFGSQGQTNLRNRVSTVYYSDAPFTYPDTYNNATHYSYDIHGNATTVVQEYSDLVDLGIGVFKMDYQYDLISGNVNEVKYESVDVDEEKLMPDRFIHHYSYDADNRLTDVYSTSCLASSLSDNGESFLPLPGTWEKEAKYFYSNLGPMARMEIGDKQVQALDYAYNLHGWLKGVNSSVGRISNDMGGDASTEAVPGSTDIPSLHTNFTSDAFGFTLHYFNGDYTPVSTDIQNFESTPSGYMNDDPARHRDLFNGNISAMTSAIHIDSDNDLELDVTPTTLGRNFLYDQLNRIRQAQAYVGGFNAETLTDTIGKYGEEVHFDMNGNITTLQRKGNTSGYSMDYLRYYYYRQDGSTYDPSVSTPIDATNKLSSVSDMSGVSDGAYPDDFEDQDPENYTYDAIGNLIHDDQEGIDIFWNLQGKIEKIVPTDTGDDPIIEYTYDAQGNRTSKTIKPRSGGVIGSQLTWKTTFYVMDASGEVMAVYEKRYSPSSEENIAQEDIYLVEQHIYGSSKLGYRNKEERLLRNSIEYAGFDEATGQFLDAEYLNEPIIDPEPAQEEAILAIEGTNGMVAQQYKRRLGHKRYQLANHLGNVLTVITDRRIGVDNQSFVSNPEGNYVLSATSINTYLHVPPGTGNYSPSSSSDGIVDYYQAEIVISSEYSCYGAQLPDWHFESSSYRYGFQGQETEDDINGTNSYISYTFRVQDVRIGKFLSIDPLSQKYPFYSPYAFSGNRVIDMVELEGAEPDHAGKAGDTEETYETGASGEMRTITTTPLSVIMGGMSGAVQIPANSSVYWVSNGTDITTGEGLGWTMIGFTIWDESHANFGDDFWYDAKLNWFKTDDGFQLERSYGKGLVNNVGGFGEGFMIAISDPGGFYNAAVEQMKSSLASYGGNAQLWIGASIYNGISGILGGLWRGGIERQNVMANFHLGLTIGGPFSAEMLATLYTPLRNFYYNPFSLKAGFGIFGKDGWIIGGYKIEAMYRNPSLGLNRGTIFSIKQLKQGGFFYRLDYGNSHLTGKVGLHCQLRYIWKGKTYGNTGTQRTWFPSMLKPPYFGPIKY